MFTGIITNLGAVIQKKQSKLTIKADKSLLKKIENGTSISVDGICLTAVEINEESFVIDFMPETHELTNIKYLVDGDIVNLELPATPATFLSGHILQGHVDGVGRLEELTEEGNSRILKFSIPKSLSKYIVEKGSIGVNGISLTVIDVANEIFTVGIIPYTWDNTMLSGLIRGSAVNIEVDVLAKYLEKLNK